VPWAFRSPAEAPLRHGADFVGLGRWLRQGDQLEEAAVLFRRAIDLGLGDELLFRTMWDLALVEKRRRHSGAGRIHRPGAAKHIPNPRARGIKFYDTPSAITECWSSPRRAPARRMSELKKREERF
jgi:hypothetical protein